MKIAALIKKLSAIHKARGNVEVVIQGNYPGIVIDKLEIAEYPYLSDSGRKQIGVLIKKDEKTIVEEAFWDKVLSDDDLL